MLFRIDELAGPFRKMENVSPNVPDPNLVMNKYGASKQRIARQVFKSRANSLC
jgi:hypothetical protein